MLKTFSRVGLIILILAASGLVHASTVLILGDSLSAGYRLAEGESWPELMTVKLAECHPKSKLINSSVSGETTGQLLSRLPDVIMQAKPNLTVVAIGANDGLRGLSTDLISNNLAKIIEELKAADSKVLITSMRLPPNYGANFNAKFEALYTELAETHQVELIEFPLEKVALDPNLMQADGLHPNALAQPIIMQELWPKISEMLANS